MMCKRLKSHNRVSRLRCLLRHQTYMYYVLANTGVVVTYLKRSSSMHAHACIRFHSVVAIIVPYMYMYIGKFSSLKKTRGCLSFFLCFLQCDKGHMSIQLVTPYFHKYIPSLLALPVQTERGLLLFFFSLWLYRNVPLPSLPPVVRLINTIQRPINASLNT